jgi:glucan phosphorylase
LKDFKSMKPAPIAYFCAEYGLDSDLPIYAGGLGVLAGDTLKAAAETKTPMIGVGLLYRGKKARQKITDQGKQIELDQEFDPVEVGLEHVYHQGQPLFIKVHLRDRYVWARVWKKELAEKTVLYLLDTNTDQNQAVDRSINDALYFGDPEKQLKQQFILGIGGVKLIGKLRLRPKLFHVNEGRPGFMFWQLIRQTMQQQDLDYYQALHQVKQKIVYTNHTLVAAGNYFVPVDHLAEYARFYAKDMEISVDELMAPGLANSHQGFSMTDYSLKMSRAQNGVSQLHTNLSKQIWPSYDWRNVTNGVHLKTWQDQRLKNPDLSDQELWEIHSDNKQKLQNFVKARTGFGYDSERLVIGWARRLAGYKRLDSVFADVDRLASIVKNEQRPVQLLFAGKAHQEDEGGKGMLHQVLKYMANQVSGHALFIPDYNLEVANYLVKGCDIWLNIPERGKEACGTSGMKAISNGVLQCTTKDGWADEVEWFEKGWTLPTDNVSHHFYQTLEEQISPLFYERPDGLAYNPDWLAMMKRSIELADQFNAKRMLRQYKQRLYQ